MDEPHAAALDPIFWLHHANINRLWVIWQSAVNNTLPPDAQWNNQTFDFFDPTGAPKNYPVTDVLQTTWPLCDRVYEDTTNLLGASSGPKKNGEPTPGEARHQGHAQSPDDGREHGTQRHAWKRRCVGLFSAVSACSDRPSRNAGSRDFFHLRAL
jgi:Common central domain of tyrosinase